MSLQPTCHSASCKVRGEGPLTALLHPSPPPPPPPGPHTARELWSQELGVHMEPVSTLLVYLDQKGGGHSVDLLSRTVCGSARKASTLGLSLSTQIVYIHSRFVSDCRDLFLIATTQG